MQDGGNDLYYIVNDCNGGSRNVNLGSGIGEEQDGSTYFGICSEGTTSNLFKYGPSGSPFAGLPGMNVSPNLTVCSVDLDCLPVLPAPATPTPTPTVTPTPTPTSVPLDCDNNIVAGNNSPLSDRGYWRGDFNIGTIDTNAYTIDPSWTIIRFTYSNSNDSNTLWLEKSGTNQPWTSVFDSLTVTSPQGSGVLTPANSNSGLSGVTNVGGNTVVYYTWNTPDVAINNGDDVCLEWSGTAPSPTPTPTSTPTPTPTPLGCTQFTSGDSSNFSGVCETFAFNSWSHNGSNAEPEVGDTVYNTINCGAGNEVGSGYYRLTSGGYYKTNGTGVVQETGPCL